MDLILGAVAFVLVCVVVFCLGTATFAPVTPVGQRMRKLLSDDEIQQEASADLSQWLDPLSKLAPGGEKAKDTMKALLSRAGYRSPRSSVVFMGLRVAVALGLCILILLVQPSAALLFAPGAMAVGYILPIFALRLKIAARKRAIGLALPDALDLAVICVEAGLGLNQTFSRIALELRESHPALADELRIMQLEMNAGKERREALANLAERTDVEDVRGLVAVLVQTDRFGTSVADALRSQSDSLRTERRQRAEEAAAKTTIKMIPALVIFIFPALFVITLGPVAINIARTLLPTLAEGR